MTNYIGVVQGAAGSGKTQLLAEHARDWAACGAWVVLQDPDYQFVTLCHATPYRDAETFLRCLDDLRGSEKTTSRLISLGCVDEAPVTDLGLRLAESQSRPVFLGYDEAVLIEGATPHYVTPRFRSLLARRRHLNVACEVLSQDFGLLHAVWQRLATHAYIFQCLDRQRSDLIARRFGLPPQDLWNRVSTLGRYQYAIIRQGFRPVVNETGQR